VQKNSGGTRWRGTVFDGTRKGGLVEPPVKVTSIVLQRQKYHTFSSSPSLSGHRNNTFYSKCIASILWLLTEKYFYWSYPKTSLKVFTPVSSPFLCWILFSNILAGYYTILGLVMDDIAGKYLDNLGFLLLRRVLMFMLINLRGF
jgi:hypothetical protein